MIPFVYASRGSTRGLRCSSSGGCSWVEMDAGLWPFGRWLSVSPRAIVGVVATARDCCSSAAAAAPDPAPDADVISMLCVLHADDVEDEVMRWKRWAKSLSLKLNWCRLNWVDLDPDVIAQSSLLWLCYHVETQGDVIPFVYALLLHIDIDVPTRSPSCWLAMKTVATWWRRRSWPKGTRNCGGQDQLP